MDYGYDILESEYTFDPRVDIVETHSFDLPAELEFLANSQLTRERYYQIGKQEEEIL